MNETVRYEVVALSRQAMLFGMLDRCQCCGREELKKTVPVRRRGGGDIVWMGTGCAAKACGMGLREYKAAVDAAEKVLRSEEQKAHDAELARWSAWLHAQTGMTDIFLAIQKLGGYPVARAAYKAVSP